MRPRIHAAFVVAGAVFVVLLCAAAVRATPSILIVPLEREFGWSRALLSSAVSVSITGGRGIAFSTIATSGCPGGCSS